MSWSISLMGTPEKVIEALSKQSGNLSGQSKVEYDEALPALIILVGLNVGQVVKIVANGHASFSDGIGGDVARKKSQAHLSVNIEPVYGLIV